MILERALLLVHSLADGYLKVGLAVEGGGESHVVQGAAGRAGAAEGRHARYAVLRLVGRQLASELLRSDVGLGRKRTLGPNIF